MDESRRERKKRQTRQLLATTATKLFAEQGYEQTTVAQIAAAADVATKTFFNYFPTKEDVLFDEADRYVQVMLDAIADRPRGELLPDLLARVCDQVFDRYREGLRERDPEVAEVYGRLVRAVPALQAKALHVMYDVQRRIAGELVRAYPDELDPVSAAAVVGSLTGALQGAGFAGQELGRSAEEVVASSRRGFDIAMRGLRSFRGGTPG